MRISDWSSDVCSSDLVLRHADIYGIHRTAKDDLAQAIEKITYADGCHKQRRGLLVDQIAQHPTLDRQGNDPHEHGTDEKRQDIGQKQVVETQPPRNTIGKTGHAQRSHKTKRALGETA